MLRCLAFTDLEFFVSFVAFCLKIGPVSGTQSLIRRHTTAFFFRTAVFCTAKGRFEHDKITSFRGAKATISECHGTRYDLRLSPIVAFRSAKCLF